uniref:SERPIN domain-containing protein n=1 Tax=Panagrellus redivivus TaxID=6233 RepID=A0A7E4VPU6_PANRE
MGSTSVRSVVILLACLAIWAQCYTITTSKVTNSKELTTKISNFNATVKTMLGKAFITQAVQAGASEDPTIRSFMISVYNIPLAGLMCLFTNYQKIQTSLEGKSFTVDNIVAAANTQCSGYSSNFNAIKTNVAQIQTRYANSTPSNMVNFPNSFKNLVISLTSFGSLWSAASTPSNDLTKAYNALVKQYNSINKADRKKVFTNIIPWSKKYIKGDGALAKPLKNTLDLLSACVAKLQIVNSGKLSPPVTKLATGFTTILHTVLKWVVTKTNTLTVTKAIKSDSTVTAMANSAVNYASNYGPAILNTDEMQLYIKTAIAGKYTITM